MNIIAQLQGGLGNQLFQYATGRALALQKQASLLLDHSWYTQTYDDVTPRELLLSELNTKGSLISFQPKIQRPKRIQRIAQKFWPINPFVFTEQAPYRFDPRLIKSPAFKQQNLYLMGYWQSYKYFESIKSILQSEISPKKPLDTHYQNYLLKIQATTSAMVHVRRGDYVNLASAAKVHGFVGLDYYHEGMKLLLERNPETHFFVFSDDIEWAKEKLPYPERATFVQSLNSSDAVIQELELMTHCQNHLIANSSLSWWAAWLSKNPNGTIYCPKKWMNDTSLDLNDLLPPSWQRI
ncbi:alpha-1,2-fucosyltransferase [Polynucleobacter sp. AP-Reno-20A-A9]|uniref:alpha-1,2-fucosyltransferase n=1 Tax=Polynucleobacter sp. AP-Reno-20A-A9 TaxID=2576925 RepID=UPI001C0C187F|nr:alpha-1,2-fucosyltransferase [Polynucleobacter sp. AP-Reno-20A-A9]MBU3627579.1 alpha-1,2-fucosyltransferase [Polynucleobacter sp. AP-Reno-20A-A9]